MKLLDFMFIFCHHSAIAAIGQYKVGEQATNDYPNNNRYPNGHKHLQHIKRAL